MNKSAEIRQDMREEADFYKMASDFPQGQGQGQGLVVNRKRFRHDRKAPSAPTLGHRGDRRVSEEVLPKMRRKREKATSRTSPGNPPWTAGSELMCVLSPVCAQESKNSKSSTFLRTDSHFACKDADGILGEKSRYEISRIQVRFMKVVVKLAMS